MASLGRRLDTLCLFLLLAPMGMLPARAQADPGTGSGTGTGTGTGRTGARPYDPAQEAWETQRRQCFAHVAYAAGAIEVFNHRAERLGPPMIPGAGQLAQARREEYERARTRGTGAGTGARPGVPRIGRPYDVRWGELVDARLLGPQWQRREAGLFGAAEAYPVGTPIWTILAERFGLAGCEGYGFDLDNALSTPDSFGPDYQAAAPESTGSAATGGVLGMGTGE